MANQWDSRSAQNNTQSQSNSQYQTQQRQQQAPPPAPPTSLPGREAAAVVRQTQENQRPAFKVGQATITAGKAGELCLGYKWIDVSFPDYDSVRFDVTSTGQSSIEIDIVQDLYKKRYAGTGTVGTSTVPRAPTGTKGKMIARDTATGETIEVPWTWYDKGGRASSVSLWQMIKQLIWKG